MFSPGVKRFFGSNEIYYFPQFTSSRICHRSGQNLSYDTLNFQVLKIRMVSAFCGHSKISIGFTKENNSSCLVTSNVKARHGICIFRTFEDFPLNLLRKMTTHVLLYQMLKIAMVSIFFGHSKISDWIY